MLWATIIRSEKQIHRRKPNNKFYQPKDQQQTTMEVWDTTKGQARGQLNQPKLLMEAVEAVAMEVVEVGVGTLVGLWTNFKLSLKVRHFQIQI
jgi:hypothetical protein